MKKSPWTICALTLSLLFVVTCGTNHDQCFDCHARSEVFTQTGFPPHDHHVHVLKWGTELHACTACHRSHGGVRLNDAIVSPGSSGSMSHTKLGDKRGTCTLYCHGEDHTTRAYCGLPPSLCN